MINGVVTRAEAIASGISSSAIARKVRAGEWERLHESIYLAEKREAGAERWLAELTALLLASGEDAVVSHRSAAVLHQLDGVLGEPLEITVPFDSTCRRKNVTRTRIDHLPGCVVIENLRVTSKARTIRDLSRHCSVDVLELVVESALRGPDRARPEVWNTRLLAELRHISLGQGPGIVKLRRALARRTDDDRPTGSLPETLLLQALRRHGIRVIRQPTVQFESSRTRVPQYFPDFLVANCRLLLEVDGLVGHSSHDQQRRDIERQNRLLPGFRLMRFAASSVLADADAIAVMIRDRALSLSCVGDSWTEDGVTVSRRANDLFLVA